MATGAQTDQASITARVAQGDVPLNLVETPDGTLVSTNSGYGTHYLLAYDEIRKRVLDRLEFESLWYGLEYEPRRKVFLASSGSNAVFEIPWLGRKFGKPRKITLEGCELTAGLAFVGPHRALVACNQNHRVIEFDSLTGKTSASATVGEYPYAVKVLPGRRIAVSNWGQSSVTILDSSHLKTLRTIQVGRHPSDMLWLKRSNQLLVACSDSDLVSVVDLQTLRETRRLNLQIPGSALGGAQPDALAFDPDRGRLYVALAAVNALGVFSLREERDDEMKFLGIIPVGTYPTALLYSAPAHTLYIAEGRNAVTGPNSPSPSRDTDTCSRRSDSGSRLDYIGCLIGGGIDALPDATTESLETQMKTLAQQVYGAKQEHLAHESEELIQYFSAQKNRGNPVRHVVYVIKENRTYDQVLGDLKEGNGDPELVLFGESVTPNQHALARDYILFDNFFVDGDVSADGHLWSTAAGATDYINKLWPSHYSGRVKFDLWGSDYDGDATHDHPVAVPGSGFIWDLAQKAGVSYRVYGELCVDDENHPGTSIAYLRGLRGHYDPYYLDGIGDVTDQKRMDEFEREFRRFEQDNDLPQLIVMHLPNDHTVGTKPGKFTPRAMVADNDLAVGRLVDLVSHSRFWASIAIFILEDDAQDGPDHVDAHRSPLYVVSPYTRRGRVEHSHFSTVSVLKTIEQILGLPSLTYFDDRAPSLLVDFQKQPVLDPYTALRPTVPLDEENPPDSPGAKESASWDFSRPDAAPEMELNRVIWKSVKGRYSEPPACVFSVQAHVKPSPELE